MRYTDSSVERALQIGTVNVREKGTNAIYRQFSGRGAANWDCKREIKGNKCDIPTVQWKRRFKLGL